MLCEVFVEIRLIIHGVYLCSSAVYYVLYICSFIKGLMITVPKEPVQDEKKRKLQDIKKIKLKRKIKNS